MTARGGGTKKMSETINKLYKITRFLKFVEKKKKCMHFLMKCELLKIYELKISDRTEKYNFFSGRNSAFVNFLQVIQARAYYTKDVILLLFFKLVK